MTAGGPGTPCIPLRACCARTRPLSLKRKGTVWIPACAGMTGSPRVCRGHPPLTAFAPPYAGAKGARHFTPPLWIPACAGMTGLVVLGYGLVMCLLVWVGNE